MYSVLNQSFAVSTAALPPSYDEVVAAVPPAGSGEPTAPPQSELPAAATPLMAHHAQSGYDGRDTVPNNTRRGKGLVNFPILCFIPNPLHTASQPAAKPKCDSVLDGYVKFSLAHTLRMNLEPDPNRQVCMCKRGSFTHRSHQT